MVGGSSGTALAGALEAIKQLKIGKGKRVVVLFPDSIRNYITKFINNDWMFENNFISEQECLDLSHSKLIPSQDWGRDYTIKDLQLKEAAFINEDQSIEEAVHEMQKYSFD